MATTSSQPQKTEADPQRTAVRPGLSAPWITAYVGVGLLTLLVSLRLTLANSGTELADAGSFVRWALPISEVIHNFSMATTMGALIFAMGIIPRYAADAAGTHRGKRTTKKRRRKRVQAIRRCAEPCRRLRRAVDSRSACRSDSFLCRYFGRPLALALITPVS